MSRPRSRGSAAALLACLLGALAGCEASPFGPLAQTSASPGPAEPSAGGTPGPTGALVIDSFTVVEYRDGPYLVYAPLVWVREPTGRSRVPIEAVRFTIPGRQLYCRSWGLSVGPGATAQLNGIDPYLWANDLIFVTQGGPVAAGPATARVFVRDQDATLGFVDAEAQIQRAVVDPLLPEFNPGLSWSCP